MAGQIIISNIKTDSDNTFSILANTGTVLFSANLASGITTGIPNSSITNAKLAGSITGDKITVGSLAGNVFTANTITGDKIGQNAISSNNIVSVNASVITSGTLSATYGGTGNSGGAWTSYTPTISAATGTITTASATGFYQTIGKTCFVTLNITITNAGTGNNQLFATLPFTSAARIQTGAYGGEFNNTGSMIKGYIPTSTTQLQMTYYNNTTVISTGNLVIVTVVYEIA